MSTIVAATMADCRSVHPGNKSSETDRFQPQTVAIQSRTINGSGLLKKSNMQADDSHLSRVLKS
jgi:hypothetical protein